MFWIVLSQSLPINNYLRCVTTLILFLVANVLGDKNRSEFSTLALLKIITSQGNLRLLLRILKLEKLGSALMDCILVMQSWR